MSNSLLHPFLSKTDNTDIKKTVSFAKRSVITELRGALARTCFNDVDEKLDLGIFLAAQAAADAPPSPI